MNDLLADTPTILWYLFEPTRLSAAARMALSACLSGGGAVNIAAGTLVEVRCLIEQGRLPGTVWEHLWSAVQDPEVPVRVLPLTDAVADCLSQIPRHVVPDLADRIVAATALAHRLPLLTCDPCLQAAPIGTIW